MRSRTSWTFFIIIALGLGTFLSTSTAHAQNGSWTWGSPGFSDGLSAEDRTALLVTQGLADPLYDYFTPGLPGGESNVYTGVVDTGFQNAFAVNHDINTHYGIPVIGYLDIFTPLLGTNELEIGATIGSIFSSLIDAVSQAWDWLTSGFKSDYVSYSDTGEYSDPSGYYDSGGDNAFDDFSGYEESGGGGGGGDGGEELEEAF